MVCQAILANLMAIGYSPRQLAYIKPMSQCVIKQPIAAFCEAAAIVFIDKGPVVFRKNFSRNFIDGMGIPSNRLMNEVLATINDISQGKDIVVIDAMGGPSAGAVIGISNADIAAILSCRVLFVGKPGIGKAIDDTLLCTSFMYSKGISDIGLIYSNIPPRILDEIEKYVSKRLSRLLPKATLLGFIPQQQNLEAILRYQAWQQLAECLDNSLVSPTALRDWLDLTIAVTKSAING